MLLFSSYCIFNLILTVALLLSCFVDCIWLPWPCWGSKGRHRSASVAMAVGYCFNCPTFLPSIDGCLDWACLCGGLCEMFMFMFMFDWACWCLIEMLIGHPLRTPEVGPSWAWQTLSGRILVRWHQRLAPEDRQLLHGSWSRWSPTIGSNSDHRRSCDGLYWQQSYLTQECSCCDCGDPLPHCLVVTDRFGTSLKRCCQLSRTTWPVSKLMMKLALWLGCT